MLTNLNVRKTGRGVVLAALLAGAAVLSAQNISQVAAQDTSVQTASFEAPAVAMPGPDAAVTDAAASFIHSMSKGDAGAIWMFASEEEQEAFATEDAVLAAFAENFPALTQAKTVAVETVSQEGDTPFVQVSLADGEGNKYQASIGMWLDDAGDWKVVSLDVTSVSDRVASL
jgi:hypothetical protein